MKYALMVIGIVIFFLACQVAVNEDVEKWWVGITALPVFFGALVFLIGVGIWIYDQYRKD